MLYYNLQEAERIFYKNNIKDNDFKSQIHTVIGHTYRFNKLYQSEEITFDKTYKIPETHFIKSMTINTKLDNQEEIQKVKLEMFVIKALQNKGKEALAILNSLGNPDSLSLRIKYELYRAYDSYYTFYASKKEKDLTKSIEYLKKVIEIRKIAKVYEPSLSTFYRSISERYMKIDKPDSALCYTKIALKSAEENYDINVFAHYKYLSDAFASNGDYISALENCRKVLPSYLSVSTKAEKKSLLNIKKELTKTKNSLIKVKMISIILCITILLLFICFSIIILKLRKKYRSVLQERKNTLSQISTLKDQLTRTNFINLIHETTVEALPRLVDDINKHANRSRKFSSELSDDLNDTLNSIRSLSKDNLSVIAHSENFISANPNVKYLTTLSDMEIVILILFDLKFSSKEISELLSNSQSSVRSMKTKIKRKIHAMEGLPYDPINTFSIFSKDYNHRD
jgi:tetratricopeptide (TPR) repeat protein